MCIFSNSLYTKQSCTKSYFQNHKSTLLLKSCRKLLETYQPSNGAGLCKCSSMAAFAVSASLQQDKTQIRPFCMDDHQGFAKGIRVVQNKQTQQPTTNKKFQILNPPPSFSFKHSCLWTVFPRDSTWKQSNNWTMSSPYNYVTHLFHYTKKLAFLERFKDKMTQFLWLLLYFNSETLCFRSTCIMAFGITYTSWLKYAICLERATWKVQHVLITQLEVTST